MSVHATPARRSSRPAAPNTPRGTRILDFGDIPMCPSSPSPHRPCTPLSNRTRPRGLPRSHSSGLRQYALSDAGELPRTPSYKLRRERADEDEDVFGPTHAAKALPRSPASGNLAAIAEGPTTSTLHQFPQAKRLRARSSRVATPSSPTPALICGPATPLPEGAPHTPPSMHRPVKTCTPPLGAFVTAPLTPSPTPPTRYMRRHPLQQHKHPLEHGHADTSPTAGLAPSLEPFEPPRPFASKFCACENPECARLRHVVGALRGALAEAEGSLPRCSSSRDGLAELERGELPCVVLEDSWDTDVDHAESHI